MPEAFQIEELAGDGTRTVLRVRGHLNAATTGQLLSHARSIRTRGHGLVLNLSQVSFIASSGVGALLALGEEYREVGLEVCYAELSSVVDSVIKLLNLDSFLTIAATEEEALRRAA
ncbi:MAG: STAS domain-containing protein [Candidatus Eisenbacteria bacterium]